MTRPTRWKLTCPGCESDESVYSSRVRAADLPRLLLGTRPYRCYFCGERFFHTPADTELPPEKRSDDNGVKLSAICPNCEQETTLLLTLPEQAQAQEQGWYVSCSHCSAAFVYRPS